MEKHLYHGSRIGGIKSFEPQPHFVGKDKSIVFATNDINYALAMIYGTGDELAVSYAVNQQTGKREMFVDELQPGKLDLLEKPGYIYEIIGEDFRQSSEGLENEYISYAPAPVISEKEVTNIADELRSVSTVHLVRYEDILRSMKERNKVSEKPEIEHAPDRFKD